MTNEPTATNEPHDPVTEETPPPESRMRRWRRGARAWCARRWAAVRPGPEARTGAIWGAVAMAIWAIAIVGLYLRTGFGYAFDFGFTVVAAAIILGGTMLVMALLMWIARKVPVWTTALIAGCWVVVMMAWSPPPLGAVIATAVGLAEITLGATIATFWRGRFGEAALSKKILTAVLCLAALAANGYFVWLAVHEGSNENLVKWKPPVRVFEEPPMWSVQNPSETGPYRVRSLFYGTGTDLRRPEYRGGVDLKTRTVDASDFFEDYKGWKRWSRQKYWGFGMDKLPLNARVWYPEGAGPFPLVLIVHGNHDMSEFSDPGYEYLGELLASRGFILASIDENFLNGGLFHDPPKQQAVRGWMLLEHLKLWKEWNAAAGNPFSGKVDMERIALMGHSRGGEAAATAAAFNRMKYAPENANIKFDYGFAIQAVVAIAPADGQYKPAGQHRWIQNVSYLTLQGGHDADVSSFMGGRQWDHVRYTEAGPWFKAEIWAYNANHGQFNTTWGRTDAGEPFSWLLNLKPLMPGTEQRRISKTYISAFLEATLKGRREYVPLFQDWREGRLWLPDTLYVNRYQDATYVPLAGFSEDADLTTTTAPGGTIAGEGLSTWREGKIPWRSGDRDYNGVFLGWNRADGAASATYSMTLPQGAAESWRLGPASTVELSVAAMDEDASLPGKKKDEDKSKKKPDKKKKDREAPDFTIELVSSDGSVATAVVSKFASVPPPLKETFTKIPILEGQAYDKDWEPVFQTVRIPVGAFQGQVDPSKIATLRLRFDRTKTNVICISGAGFGKQ